MTCGEKETLVSVGPGWLCFETTDLSDGALSLDMSNRSRELGFPLCAPGRGPSRGCVVRT